MEVIKDCPTIDEFAGSAQMVESGANVRVLAQAPSFVLLVPTIDGEEVAPPHSHVATDDSALGGVSPNQRQRKTKTFGSTRQLAGEEKAKARQGWAGLEGVGGGWRKIRAATLNPESTFGQRGMVLEKLRVGNAVCIGENEIVPLCGSESAVEDDIFSKALVFVPEVVNRAGKG
jgi:hypothetical protein